MRVRPLLRMCAAFYALSFASGLMAQTLQVVNADGKATTLTVAQIAAVPHVTVNVKDHDTPAQFEGVPLSAVLTLAGVQLGSSLRGPRMAEARWWRLLTATRPSLPWPKSIPILPPDRSSSPTNVTASRWTPKKARCASLLLATNARRDGCGR